MKTHAIAATMIGTKTLFARDLLGEVKLERMSGPVAFVAGGVVGF